jgi:SOS-response transcriptional repressor LexA
VGSSFSFTAELWEHDGPASWFFLSLPEALADDLEEMFGHRAAGFGSLKVEVTIGATRWSTSLFPDNKRATYLLPVKKAVRTAEGLVDGSTVEVELVVV